LSRSVKAISISVVKAATTLIRIIWQGARFVSVGAFTLWWNTIRTLAAPYFGNENRAEIQDQQRPINLFHYSFLLRAGASFLLLGLVIYLDNIAYTAVASLFIFVLFIRTADIEEKIWIWIVVSTALAYYSYLSKEAGLISYFFLPLLLTCASLLGGRYRAKYTIWIVALALFACIVLIVANEDPSVIIYAAIVWFVTRNPKATKSVGYFLIVFSVFMGLTQVKNHWLGFDAYHRQPIGETFQLIVVICLAVVLIKKIKIRHAISIYLCCMIINLISAQYILDRYIQSGYRAQNFVTLYWSIYNRVHSVSLSLPHNLPVVPSISEKNRSFPLSLPTIDDTLIPKLQLPTANEILPGTLELTNTKMDRSFNFVESPVSVKDDLSIRTGSAAVVLLFYLKKMILPYPMAFYYGYKEFAPEDLMGFKPILSLILHIFLVIIFLRLYQTQTIPALGLIIYFVGAGSFSGFLQPIAGVAADRFAVIPSLGFCLLFAWLLYKIFRLKVDDHSLAVSSLPGGAKYSFLLVLLMYAGITFGRGFQWRDDLTLMRHDIKIVEQSAQAHNLLAMRLMKHSDMESDPDKKAILISEALTHFQSAIKIYPRFFNVAYYAAKAYSQIGANDSAIAYYKRALSIDNTFSEVHLNLGDLLQNESRYKEAIPYYEFVVKDRLNEYTGYDRLSYTYFLLGDLKQSIEVNKIAIQKVPGIVNPYVNIGRTYLSMNEPDSAAIYLRNALQIDSGNVLAKMLQKQLSTGNP
jgi:tetratricopeptide (TPR) repeat protein